LDDLNSIKFIHLVMLRNFRKNVTREANLYLLGIKDTGVNNLEIQLPSNRNFGFFFTGIFFLSSSYFYLGGDLWLAGLFSILSLLFFSITILKADLLFYLNKYWLRFGLLIGMIVAPIVFGLIFFGIFTPISLIMRFFGRDELRLRLVKKNSYWITCKNDASLVHNFMKQF
jgi:hypothetical protein